MLESVAEDLFLPAGPEAELVDQLLSGLDLDGGGSLAKAFQPLPESPCPPLVPWDCSTRYKTELCSSYSNSASCRYAEHCQFAHGLHELRAPFRHPKYKTELCRNFHATGYCYYGVRCLFVHGAAEQRPVVRRRRSAPCRNLRAFGVCPFGTRCLFQHAEGKGGERGGGGGGPGEKRGGGPGEERGSGPGEKHGGPGEERGGGPGSPAAKTPSDSQVRDWKSSKSACQTFSTFGFCLYGTRCLFQHCLPKRTRPDQNQRDPPRVSRLPSANSTGSSTSSSPPPCTPTPDAAAAHNAFTFSSRHLSELLLPLALQLQTQTQHAWDSRAV